MPFATNEHPPETILHQFLGGNLSNTTLFQVEEHLASCSQCRSRLDRFIEDGSAADTPLRSLTQAFIRSGFDSPDPDLAPKKQIYPDFETIAAYMDGTLTPQQTQEFEALMSQLPRLAQEVAELRESKEELQPTLSPSRASMAANETADKVPPMVIKPVTELPTDLKAWWKWRWPMQSLGLATAAALFAVIAVVKPWQQKHSGQPGPTTPGVVPTAEGTFPDGGTTRSGSFTPTQKRLLAVSNPNNQSQTLLQRVKVVPYKAQGSFDRARRWHLSVAPNARQQLAPSQRLEFKRGEGVQFRFENQSERPLYLVLLWLSLDGGIAPMKPSGAGNSPVIKLTSRGTPGAQTSTRIYGINSSAGVEKIKFFVSTRPINPEPLKFDGTGKSASQTKGRPSSLDVVLRRALGVGARSKPATASDNRTWATTTREIRIREK